MNRRCFDVFRADRCELPLGHEGFHRHGSHTWGFRDLAPEWRKRGAFRRDLTGIEPW